MLHIAILSLQFYLSIKTLGGLVCVHKNGEPVRNCIIVYALQNNSKLRNGMRIDKDNVFLELTHISIS